MAPTKPIRAKPKQERDRERASSKVAMGTFISENGITMSTTEKELSFTPTERDTKDKCGTDSGKDTDCITTQTEGCTKANGPTTISTVSVPRKDNGSTKATGRMARSRGMDILTSEMDLRTMGSSRRGHLMVKEYFKTVCLSTKDNSAKESLRGRPQ